MRHLGAGHGPAGNVYLSEANSNNTLASRGVLHLSDTTFLRVGGFKEQPCVLWGVIVSIHVIVVHRETVGPRATIIRVKNNEVDYLLTHLAPLITVPFRYADKTPSMRGPFKVSEKSSWLSDDAASSSLEDMSTTAGCRDVMCVRRAYTNSQHRGGLLLVSISVGPCA